ncbi:hypothetical protein [Bifidobacterium felsineum]|uniref:hypothetical protein n=1 Tax=Bifidobacterium felsineum TaxID=2045440 RepID=UPI001BDDA87B|nr:hypothetical protein [Bifidobacterium felsineum]MBT1163016.1 hypothetical protein [Bifidobacterium felsineum]
MNNLHEPAHLRKSHISKQAKILEKTGFARRVENAVFNPADFNISPKSTANCLKFVSYRRVSRKFIRIHLPATHKNYKNSRIPKPPSMGSDGHLRGFGC